MKPFDTLAPELARKIDFVLCDLDDTLTSGGRLPAASYAGLEELSGHGKKVIVVTGRPAGWCDMIARFWPVEGVVGENGAFYFRYRRGENRMVREFQRSEGERGRDRERLLGMLAQIRLKYPELRLAADQPFRISDIAIDMCEDVKPLPKAAVKDVAASFGALGAKARVSSIHINAWMGDFDKLSMLSAFLRDEFGMSKSAAKAHALYVGDSPNDEPMFAHFAHTVGVRNIENFAAEMRALPKFITRAAGGQGFLEVAGLLTRAAKPVSPKGGRSRKSSSPRRR